MLLFCPSWSCTIICCIIWFTSLCKNLLEFLAEAFRCHVYRFQCLTVPVEIYLDVRNYPLNFHNKPATCKVNMESRGSNNRLLERRDTVHCQSEDRRGKAVISRKIIALESIYTWHNVTTECWRSDILSRIFLSKFHVPIICSLYSDRYIIYQT